MHERQCLLQNVEKINSVFLSMSENSLTKFLLYGLPDSNNIFLLNSVINYILFTNQSDNLFIL